MADILFDQALVTMRDASTLEPGELQTAIGCEYRLGTDHLHKQPGRTRANSTGLTTTVGIEGLGYLQYEGGSDVLAAVADGSVYESTPGTSLTFGAAELTGLTAGTTPKFTNFADRWILTNGQDTNQIREPADVPGTSSAWRRLGMLPPAGQTTVVANTASPVVNRPSADSGDFTNPANAYDTDSDTYALGTVNSGDTQDQHTFNVTAGSTTNGHTLYITFAGFSEAGPQLPDYKRDLLFGDQSSSGFNEEEGSGTITIEYDFTATPFTGSEVTLKTVSGKVSKQTISVAVPNGTNFADIDVRVTVDYDSGETDYRCAVYDIRVSNSNASTFDLTTGLKYFVTERYVDSDGVQHESTATLISDLLTGTAIRGAIVDLPAAAANSFSTEFVIYRTLDTTDGSVSADGSSVGYPFLFEVGTAPIAQAGSTWTDDFTLSLTSAIDKTHIYDIITILYPDGSSLDYPLNSPPPKAKFAILYQGSVVYIPVDIPRRVYYSIPTSLSAAAGEQVPSIYFLEFETDQNDAAVTAALTNGGRSMIVYFPSQTALVNFLPQATDPGRFDQRVREFVSDKRGASGRLTSTSFTPDDGITTLAAAVDDLGLWVTDGVGFIRNWSDDLKWRKEDGEEGPSGAFDGVTLSDGILINNPQMRRLEFIYQASGGSYEEYHFFYGKLKRNQQPKITGPHPAGWRSKLYANLSGTWRGWAGMDNRTLQDTTQGYVFTERQQAKDASEAQDANGSVPFQAKTGDIYESGLGSAILIEDIYPKFGTVLNKNITFNGTYRRDGASAAQTVSKTFKAGTQKKMYVHRYADRHTLEFTDITPTAMPPLVGCTYKTRGVGEGRE